MDQTRRVAELMDFVENYHRFVVRAKEKLRIAHHLLHFRQVAVDIQNPLWTEAFRQRGFAASAHPAEPDDGGFLPPIPTATNVNEMAHITAHFPPSIEISFIDETGRQTLFFEKINLDLGFRSLIFGYYFFSAT